MSRTHFQKLMNTPEHTPTAAVSIEECQVEIESICSDLERYQHGLNQLTDLSEASEYIPDASLEHLALFESAIGNIENVTGIDLAFPAMESYKGTCISQETFRERVSQIINWIIERFKALMSWIGNFWNALTDEIRYQRVRLKFIKETLHQKQGRFPKEISLSLTGIAPWLLVRGGLPTQSQQILKELKNQTDILADLKSRYVPIIEDTMRRVSAAMASNEWKNEASDLWLTNLNEAAKGISVATLKPVLSSFYTLSDPRFPSGAAWSSIPFLGDRCVILVDGARGNKLSDDPIERARQTQNTVLLFRRPKPNPPNYDNLKPEITAFGSNEISDIIKRVEVLLDDVEAINIRSFETKMHDLMSKLETLSRNIPEQGRSQALVQAGVGYVTAMRVWSKEPFMAMAGHSLRVCGALITLCNRALKNL